MFTSGLEGGPVALSPPQKASSSPLDPNKLITAELLITLKNRAFKLTRNRTDAEDLVQQTVLKLCVAFQHDKYKPDPNLNPEIALLKYASGILENASRDNIRRERIRSISDCFDEAVRVLVAPPTQETDFSISVDFTRAFSALKPREREILLLVSKDTPYAEIAIQFGIAEGTVKCTVFRLRKKIAHII